MMQTLASKQANRFRQTALVCTSVVAVGLIGLAVSGIRVQPLIAVLVFILLTLLVSALHGTLSGLLVALACDAALTYFFMPPVFELLPSDDQYLLALLVLPLVSTVGASLLESNRALAVEAQRGRKQAEVLLHLNRAMIGQIDPEASLVVLCREVIEAFAAGGAAVITQRDGGWQVMAFSGGDEAGRSPSPDEVAQAERALRDGLGSHLAGRSDALFVPLVAGGRALGVLRLDGPSQDELFHDEPDELIKVFAGEAALTLSRLELARSASQADALRQTDELKTALLSSISHQLKTPVATIMASTSSLLDDSVRWTEANRSAFLASISDEAVRLDRTISDLLDLNRIDAGALRPILISTSLAQIAEEAMEVASASLQDREVLVDVPDTEVFTDGSLIRHALANLLENAVVHSRPGGVIRLAGCMADGKAQLSVEDEGPGIEARELPSIFNPFYKAQNGKSTPKAGSGLGLAIVKGFVAVCGGEVSVESTATSNRFSIRLPVQASQAKATVRV